MNDKIISTRKNDWLVFYMVTRQGQHYLFTQRYSKGVFAYFQGGRMESELRNFHQWRKNPRLSKTIEKIPLYTRYVRKELIS